MDLMTQSPCMSKRGQKSTYIAERHNFTFMGSVWQRSRIEGSRGQLGSEAKLGMIGETWGGRETMAGEDEEGLSWRVS